MYYHIWYGNFDPWPDRDWGKPSNRKICMHVNVTSVNRESVKRTQ